jgi:uncharacterized protein
METLRSSFVAEGIVSFDTKQYGRGLKTTRPFKKDEELLRFSGKEMSLAEFFTLPQELIAYPHQIDDNLMFGPTSVKDVGVAEFVNHSCNPNSGFFDEITLVAIRTIQPGEQITIDYAFSETFALFSMECKCKEPDCRKIITCDDWMLTSLQAKYSKYFQPYIKAKLPSYSLSQLVMPESLATLSQEIL